ncbi:unnamed protein product [Trichogramma brassicae]|uniref:Uncharacterized protein n=1 Tax=Trichogramma brassicae TaxID=86971 RepID=A0A6H5IL08_9HYME|nr:unnamed protein product [Trichogramma brassicae]
MNRIRIVESLLSICKEYFLYDDACDALDATTGSAAVELVRSLMGALPEFAHLVQIADFLVLAHQTSEIYVTHSRHNMYFLLPPLPPQEVSHKSTIRLSSLALNSVSQESLGLVKNIKITKALTNVEIQRGSRLNPTQHDIGTQSSSDERRGETRPWHRYARRAPTVGFHAQPERRFRLPHHHRAPPAQHRKYMTNTSAATSSGGMWRSARTRRFAACAGDKLILRVIIYSPIYSRAPTRSPPGRGHQSGHRRRRMRLRLAAADAASSGDSIVSYPYSASRRACRGVMCEGLLLLLRDAMRVLPDSQVYLQRVGDEQLNKFIKQRYFVHLANHVALYPGSELLVVTLENLALKEPSLSAVPPVLAMISRTAASDMNDARPLVTFVTDLITKNPNSPHTLLEQGLMETLGRGIVNAAYSGFSVSLFRHVLLVSIAGRLLDSPGSQHMQVVVKLHRILN